MSKLNQRGIAHILVLLLLIAGLGVGVYLVQHQTNLFPKAAVSKPITNCRVRPLCLDANPPCRLAPPREGWCPAPTTRPSLSVPIRHSR